MGSQSTQGQGSRKQYGGCRGLGRAARTCTGERFGLARQGSSGVLSHIAVHVTTVSMVTFRFSAFHRGEMSSEMSKETQHTNATHEPGLDPRLRRIQAIKDIGTQGKSERGRGHSCCGMTADTFGVWITQGNVLVLGTCTQNGAVPRRPAAQ